MQFCLDREAKCPENGQLLDIISSTDSFTYNELFAVGLYCNTYMYNVVIV